MRDTNYNSLDKVKKQIDDILSSELCGCRYVIYAHYNANNEYTLFSYRVKDESVYLYINIQTVKRFVEHNDWNEKASLYFCAWYVVGYVKALTEWEREKDLHTYCDGVIFSEVLYSCFCNKKIKVFAPYICATLKRCIKKNRVLDVFCEVNVLLRIKALFAQELLQDVRLRIERNLDEWMAYLNAPEVVYVGIKTPSLSIKEVIRNIRVLGKKNVKLNVPLFPKRDDKSLVINLIEAYEVKKDEFWIDLLTRMLICSPTSIKHIANGEILNKICESIEQYESCLIDDMKIYEMSENSIIIDNLNVMLRYIEYSRRLLLKAGIDKKSTRTIHINY